MQRRRVNLTEKSELPWYEDDEMWEIMEPVMFTESRIAQTPEEVDNLVSLLKIQPNEVILDLGCGIGRHSLEFARRGYKIVGVDRTKIYLERARASAAKEELELEFVLEDMLSFLRENSFDIVLSMYTSFGFSEDPKDQMRVLKNIHLSLRNGGRFVLAGHSIAKEVFARTFVPRTWDEHETGFILRERKIVNDWSMAHKTWHFIEKGGRIHRWEITHWIYSAAELKSMLMSAGFSQVQIYGSLDGSAYDNEATLIVAVATK
ncbi:MAG: class I SAM-dependent methyltransferase [Candidatus Thorarchaeota archaeon]